MRASSLSFRIAVIFALVGMGWGIQMAASQDHSAMPAHAHLNLLGWVMLFLFGVFYRLHPTLDESRIALVQVAVWVVGSAILAVGVAMVHAGDAGGEPVAAISSIVVLLDMLLFALFVFRSN